MRRTTIMLPSKLKTRAARQARNEGISLGELIRDSVEKRLAAQNGKGARDPLFADGFVFRDDLPGDVSANLDKYLDEEMDAEIRRWRKS